MNKLWNWNTDLQQDIYRIYWFFRTVLLCLGTNMTWLCWKKMLENSCMWVKISQQWPLWCKFWILPFNQAWPPPYAHFIPLTLSPDSLWAPHTAADGFYVGSYLKARCLVCCIRRRRVWQIVCIWCPWPNLFFSIIAQIIWSKLRFSSWVCFTAQSLSQMSS